jgi:TRAP-type C4-dicarboxylate transport system permease small subunit
MKKVSDLLQNLLNILLALSLALMCVLVFGNVVLRYIFNSGITWSEEISRFLFVWMIFLGAIGALKDNEHLGIDMLVKRLPSAWKKTVYVLSNMLVLYILWLIFDGSRKLTLLNMDSKAPATGMPLSYLHAIGMIMSVGMALIVIFNICRALFQAGSIDILIQKKESEEEILHPPMANPFMDRQEVTGGHR